MFVILFNKIQTTTAAIKIIIIKKDFKTFENLTKTRY